MADGGTQMFDASVQTTTVSVGDGAITDSARQVVMANNPLFRRCFKRKPLEVVHAEEEEGVLERTLGFWDLFALGFGGTVGSGVFVMTGLICHEIAGPSGIVSWFVAGFGCLLSGLSFAELSWRVPSAGGAYAYAFVALGEMPAAIVGWCMTLEYGFSAAAVAKSWGEMLSVGLAHASEDESSEGAHGSDGITILGVTVDTGGVFAALLQGLCVLIVVGGLKASTITVNTFCVAKGLLVVFMTITAFSLYDAENLVPFAPHGAGGVLKGSVAAFFGFLGFDEVVLLSPEAKNPAKHVPRALFASLVAVTVVCAAASISLSGAMPAADLDSDSAFAEAFRDRGMKAAYKITAIGELVTLPLVVLVSFMAQPRLLFAMAKDGLLPHLFAEVDSRGTLLKGSLVSGGICMVTALLVPFDALDSIISAGVLLAFNIVTSSLLVLRDRACRAQPVSVNSSFHEDGDKGLKDEYEEEDDGQTIAIVMYANFSACLSAGLSILAGQSEGVGQGVLGTVAVGGGVAMLYVLAGLQSSTSHARDQSGGNFLAPFFPWPQAVALWVNWFLVCQLPLNGLLALAAYIGFAATHYACYGASRSVGNCTGWSVLLGSEEGGRPTSGSCCLLLATDDVENATVGETPTDCLSPSVVAPLLPHGGEGEPEEQQPMQRGGGESPPPPPLPTVTGVGSVRSTPAGTPQNQRVRRRSLDGAR